MSSVKLANIKTWDTPSEEGKLEVDRNPSARKPSDECSVAGFSKKLMGTKK